MAVCDSKPSSALSSVSLQHSLNGASTSGAGGVGCETCFTGSRTLIENDLAVGILREMQTVLHSSRPPLPAMASLESLTGPDALRAVLSSNRSDTLHRCFPNGSGPVTRHFASMDEMVHEKSCCTTGACRPAQLMTRVTLLATTNLGRQIKTD